MKKILILLTSLLCYPALFRALPKDSPPDTVYTGIYITSIHDIDFRQQEYTVNLWLWLKYKNRAFDFLHNLEVPQAKTVTTSYSTIDSSGDHIYILLKLQCVMKDSWRIGHFPFDRQRLRFSIENSQYDYRSLIFKEDKGGKHYDPQFTLNGWTIDSFNIASNARIYETDFGDDRLLEPRTRYSAYNVSLQLERKALDLFWKMFLGMYVAFLIAFVGFYIHADSVESRFGLNVGAIFAVVGNKYIVDSVLPESSSFTLVDTLHGITLLYVFVITVCSVYALSLVRKGKTDSANRFDRFIAVFIFVTYAALNAWYISKATGRI